MRPAPELVYTTDQPETLADIRQYVACYPEAVYFESSELACRLGRSVVEIEAAQAWMIQDALEVRA